MIARLDFRTVCIGENIIARLRAGKDVVLKDQRVTLLRASDLQQVPRLTEKLAEELRQLFDEASEAHEGDYPSKVEHGLLAVYVYGKRCK